MSTHNLVRRQPHSALGKKRFQPARLPKFPSLDLENDSKPVVEEHQDHVVPRQFGGGGFPFPITDLFPPVLPTDSQSSTVTNSSPTSTTPRETTPVSPTTSSTTSTPSSTSTSTSTSTTPTSTSVSTTPSPSTSSTPPGPTTTPPPVVVTEVNNETVVVTSSRSQSTSSTTSALGSANTSNQTDDAGSDTGPIIGGIVAGVIALAVLVVTIVWFIRRRKRAESDDLKTFNPHDFRRSAVLINDDSSLGGPGYGSGGVSGLARAYSFNSNGHSADGMSAHNHGGNPRPPTMIERKLAHTPASGHEGAGFSQYPSSSHGHGEYANGYGAEPGFGYNQYVGYQNHQHYSGPPFHSYMPQAPLEHGQVISPNAYGNPFATPAQSPFSPPVSQENESFNEGRDATGGLASPPANAAVLAQVGGAPVLTRSISSRSMRSGKSAQLSISIPKNVPVNATVIAETSTSSAHDADERQSSKVEYPALNGQSSTSIYSTRSISLKRSQSNIKVPAPLPIRESVEVPTSDYVDLTRSSVSPFQAAQYAEISKRLNTEVPQGLPSSHVEEAIRDRDLPPLPPSSPSQAKEGPFESDPDSESSRATDSVHSSISGVAATDFPVPPPSPLVMPSRHSYASTASAQHLPPSAIPPSASERIVSFPPQLPEINIDSSESSHDHGVGSYFPSSTLGLSSAKDSPIYPSGITAGGSPLLGRFPVTPSPLGTSFGLDTPKTGEISGAAVRSEQGIFMRLQQEEEEKMRRRAEAAKEKELKKKEKERPQTVYDEADAYGGF